MVVLITLVALISVGFFVIVDVDGVPLSVLKECVDGKNMVVGARRQAARACDTRDLKDLLGFGARPSFLWIIGI
jgi:hypothetical protein